MKHIGIVALLLLMAAGAGQSTAQTKTDTTKVKSDSITWSKELDHVIPYDPEDDFEQRHVDIVPLYALSNLEKQQ